MGTTTAGMMVLRSDDEVDDDDLLLVDPAELVLLADNLFVFEEADAYADAAALSELYCAGSVTTEAATSVVVDDAPLASVTMLGRVRDKVVKEVGAAADVMASVPNEVTDVEICDGSVGVANERASTRDVSVARVAMLRLQIEGKHADSTFRMYGRGKNKWESKIKRSAGKVEVSTSFTGEHLTYAKGAAPDLPKTSNRALRTS